MENEKIDLTVTEAVKEKLIVDLLIDVFVQQTIIIERLCPVEDNVIQEKRLLVLKALKENYDTNK